MLQCGLVDVDSQGPSFTWKRGGLKECLDRSMVNQEWLLHY